MPPFLLATPPLQRYTHPMRSLWPLLAIAGWFGLTVLSHSLGWAFPKWLYWAGLGTIVAVAFITRDRSGATTDGAAAAPVVPPRPAQSLRLRLAVLFGQIVAAGACLLVYSVRTAGMDKHEAIVLMLGLTALSALGCGAVQVFHLYSGRSSAMSHVTAAQAQGDAASAWAGALTGLAALALFCIAWQGRLSSPALLGAIFATIALPGLAAVMFESLIQRAGDSPLW